MSYPLPNNEQPLFYFHDPVPEEPVPMEIDSGPALPEPEEKHEINPEAEALHKAIEENRKLQKKIVKIYDKAVNCQLRSILTSLGNSEKNILELECLKDERVFRLFTHAVLKNSTKGENYYPYPALMTAIEKGYLKTTLILLKKLKETINGETIDRAITICTESITGKLLDNRQKILIQLLKLKKDKNSKEVYPAKHLCNSAERGNLASVKALIEYGYPVDGKDDKGETALHKVMKWWQYKEQIAIIEFLFEKKCNPNIKNEKNLTPICLAIKHDKRHAFSTLLKLKAKEETIKESTALPPFLYAIKCNSRKIIDYYLTKKRANKYAHKEIKDGNGMNALHFFALPGTKFTDEDKIKYTKALLSIGYNINDVDPKGQTALHIASKRSGKSEIGRYVSDKYFKFLKEIGADFSKKDNEGKTALMIAIGNGAIGTYRILLELDPTQETHDNEGNNPLHLFIQWFLTSDLKVDKLVKCIETTPLVQFFCKPNHSGKTPLDSLIDSHRFDLIETIYQVKYKPYLGDRKVNLIHFAALNGHIRLLEQIVSQENIHAPASDGSLPIHFAAMNPSGFAIPFLLNRGANIESRNSHGFTPLMMACLQGNYNAVQLLLECGANINPVPHNESLLALKIRKNKKETYEVLVKNGLSISQRSGLRFSITNLLNNKEDGIAILNALVAVSKFEQTKNFIKHFAMFIYVNESEIKNKLINEWMDKITNFEQLLTDNQNEGSRDLEIVLTLAHLAKDFKKLLIETLLKKNLPLKKQIIDAHKKYNLLEFLYEVEPSHFSKLPDDITLPDEAPEVKLSDLHDVTRRLNTLQCKIYQENRKSAGNLRELEAHRKEYDLLIKRVTEAKPMVGTPREDEPEKLQQFWKNVDVMLKLLIQKIDNLTKAFEENIENCHALSSADTLNLIKMNECMRDLKLAAPYCATRINQAVSKYYKLIYLSQEQVELEKHERQSYHLLKNIRNSIVKKTVKSFAPNHQVHIENFIFKAYGKKLGIPMPNDYRDPTVSEQAAKTITKHFMINLHNLYNSHTLATEFLKSNKEYNVKFNDFISNIGKLHPGDDLHPFIENYEDILMGQDVEAKLTVHGVLEILRSLEVLKMVF